MLQKFCKFLPVPIFFEDKQINNPSPAWTKKPSELTDEDYRNFYKELYPFSEAPLFWIHLNVDYPFNLTGILYFPKLKNNIEVQKNKIQLYSNQVFVTDSVEGIVPEFLTMLHGVLDSPDIPLNVSRSYLQSDSNVKKISQHITKKVADKLLDMFKKDRAGFETKWNDINIFVKYGIISDEKFYEKAKDFVLLKNTENKFFTLDESKKSVMTGVWLTIVPFLCNSTVWNFSTFKIFFCYSNGLKTIGETFSLSKSKVQKRKMCIFIISIKFQNFINIESQNHRKLAKL